MSRAAPPKKASAPPAGSAPDELNHAQTLHDDPREGNAARHWLDAPISSQLRINFVTDLTTTTIREELRMVREGERKSVRKVRTIHRQTRNETGDPKLAKLKANGVKKNECSYVNFHGTFSKRSNDALTRHSGVVISDLDDLADVEETKARLAACPNIGAVFLSVRGTGLRVLVPVAPIPTNAADHKAAYYSAVPVIEAAGGITVDDHAGEDVSRASFITTDPAIHINPDAVPVHWAIEKPKQKTPAPSATEDQPREQTQSPPPRSPSNNGSTPPETLASRREYVARNFRVLTWKDDTEAHVECPGASTHTSANSDTDCSIWIDGVPSMRCFHKSCRGAVEAAERRLRDELTKGVEAADIAAMLTAVRFDIHNPPPDPPPVFKLDGHSIATAGNLVAIQAQPKAGKTAQIGAMLAATMEPTGDCLSAWSENPRGLAVLHFDTEQSRADHFRIIKRALTRAGRAEPPPWLRSYCLTGMTLKLRNAAMRFELERAHAECGGIHSVFLDGLGDFAVDPNDPGEAFALIDELHQLAIRYSAPIFCVLHENPGENTSGKTRGHLGSQLERKAETNLRLSKDAEGITVVYAERARHAHIPKDRGPRFAWSNEAGMHVSSETREKIKTNAKRQELEEVAAQVFKGIPSAAGLSWTEIHKRITKVEGIKHAGARKKFQAMKNCGVIRQAGERYFLP